MKTPHVDKALLGVTLVVLLASVAKLTQVAGVSDAEGVEPAIVGTPARWMPTAGTDTVAILVVTSSCGACTIEPWFSYVRQELAMFSNRDQASRMSLIGVAIDGPVTDAMGILGRFGSFDEISAGRGWANTFAVTYMVTDSTALTSVPQLFVLERTSSSAGPNPAGLRATERLIDRATGLAAITHSLRRLRLGRDTWQAGEQS